METRLIIAYALIALMVAAAAGAVALTRYHSREATYRRRKRREDRAYAARISAQGANHR